MSKACHLVVKPSKNCINRDIEYNVSFEPNTLLTSKINHSEFAETTSSKTKHTSLYGDITGCILRTDNGAENNQRVYFSIKNPQIGWPWAVLSTDKHLERYVTHKLDKDESFTFTSIDGVKFTLERLNDTKNKEFVIWIEG